MDVGYALAAGLLLLFPFLLRASFPAVATNTWSPTQPLTVARSGAATVMLQDGRLLITGGNNGSTSVASVDIVDAAGNITAGPPMNMARSQHTATVLQDGRVLVVGGVDVSGNPIGTAEIFDPAVNPAQANPWMSTGPQVQARSGQTATLLNDGTVLIAGGLSGSRVLNTLELFNAASGASGSFTLLSGTLSSPRAKHAAALLEDGRVLIIGGWDGTMVAPQAPATTSTPTPLATTDIYDASAQQVRAGPVLNIARMSLTATTQLDGQVFVAGGNSGTQDLASTESFDPTSSPQPSTFTLSSLSLTTPRSNHLAFLLPHNGGTLLVGGTSNGTAITTAELYMPVYLSQTETATLNPVPNPMSTARAYATGSPLSDGSVTSVNDGLLLVVGGTDASGNALSSAEIFGFPWVKTDALEYAPGTPVNITGGGFQPGETVTLHFQEVPYYDAPADLTVVAQGDGTFSNSQFAPDNYDLNIGFFLTATGSASKRQAQTVFADSGQPSVSCTPGSVAVGTSTTCTASIPGQGGDGDTIGWTATPATDGSFSAQTCTISGNPGTCSVTYTPSAVPTGGQETIKGTDSNGGKSATSSVTVTKGNQTITFTTPAPSSAPYKSTFNVAATASSGLTVTLTVDSTSTGVCSIASGTVTMNSSSGSCTIDANQAGNTNYNAATQVQTSASATKATPTISISNIPSGAAYGGSFTPTSAYSGSGSPTESVVSNSTSICTVSGNTVSYIGVRTRSLTTSTATTNAYTAVTGSAQTFFVGEATLTVTASTSANTYGSTPSTPTASYSGFVNGDTSASLTTAPTCTTTVTKSTGVGIYNGANTCSGAVDGNYSIGYVAGTQTVNQAALTITADNKTKVYGAALPTFTASYSGFVNGDTSASLTTQPTITTTAMAASPVGSYAITASGAADPNYQIMYASGTLTVSQASTTTAVVSSNSPSTYGQSVTFTASVSVNAPGSGTPTGTVTFTIDGAAQSPVALSTSTATFTTSSLGASGTAHTVSASYNGDADFLSSAGALSGGQTVNQAMPVITWANPGDITYGTPLSATQLNASASVPGIFVYSPAPGTILQTGAGQSLSVTFIPGDSVDYTQAQATVQINVLQATPLVMWQNPTDITYGTALSSTQLDAVALPPAAALTGWWNGEGNPNDSIAGNPGTLQGGATYAAGVVGQAFSFPDASGDGVSIPYNSGYDLSAPGFAAALWVQGSSNSNGEETILEKSYDGSTGWSFQVNGGSGILAFDIGEGSTKFATVASAASVLDGNFHSVVGTWDGGTKMSLYVDGVLQGTTALTTPANNQGGLNIGFSSGSGSPSQYFTGTVDEVQIFRLPLPAGTYAYTPAAGTVLNAGKGQTLSATFTPTDGTDFSAASASTSLNVQDAVLTITASDGSNTYGSTPSAPAASYSGFVNGDTSSVLSTQPTCSTTVTSSSGAGTYSGANTCSGAAAANYTIKYVAGTQTVNPAPLTVTADAQTKVYGQSDPILTYKTTGFQAGDTTATALSGSLSRAAGENVVPAPGYAITQGTLVANGNYAMTFVGSYLTITPATLTAAITGNPTRPYNGTAAVTLSPSNFSLTGLVSGESFTITQTVGTYNSANVVSASTVTASLSAGNFTPGTGTLASNYVLPTTASGLGAITAVTVTAAIVGNPTRPYNGTAAATLTSVNYSLSGLVAGESFTISQTAGTYNSANVVSANSVTVGLSAGNFTPGTGTLATNYVLPTTATGSGSITAVTLTAAIVNDPAKPYDGTTTVTLSPSNFSLTGLVSGESFTVTQAIGAYNSANVLSANTVAASLSAANFTPGTGTLASNYVLPDTASGAGNITAVTLTAAIVGTPTRPYNGTTAATLAPANFSLTGLVSGESFTVSQTTGTYNSANVLSAITVTASLSAGSFTPGTGTLASNYVLPTTATGPGNITAVTLTAAIVGTPAKQYDATTTAALAPVNYSLSGLVTGESFTVTQTIGAYNSANVVSANSVTASLSPANFTPANGTLVTNYFLPSSATGPGAITKADATVSVTPYSVTYDGNAHTASGTATGVKSEPLSGLDLSGTTHTSAGNFTDTWTFKDVTGNYNDASSTVVDAIAKANATVGVSGYSVPYDGNAHTATGSAMGVKGEPLTGLDLTGTTHIGAGTYNDSWTFTDVTGNYNNASSTVPDAIAKVNPTVIVAGYSLTYDGNPHTTTGSATGVKGETLSGLDLSKTTRTNAGNTTDAWTFTDSTGNYNNASGTVQDAIAKANASVTITGYNVTYDGNPHVASGSAIGVKGEMLSGLDLSGTTHTNAGSYTSDTWSFTDLTGNYNNASGAVSDRIQPATPVAVKIANTPASAIVSGSFTPVAAVTSAPSGDPGATSVVTNTPSTCTVSGGTVSFLAVGTCSLTASVGATMNYAALTGQPQTFIIGYGFLGLAAPYAGPPTTFNVQRTMPLAWQYTNASGVVVNSAGVTPQVQITGPYACGTTDNAGDITVASAGNSGYQYNSTTSTWQFNWQVKGNQPGCYNIYIVTIVNGQTIQTSMAFPISVTSH